MALLDLPGIDGPFGFDRPSGQKVRDLLREAQIDGRVIDLVLESDHRPDQVLTVNGAALAWFLVRG